MDSTASTKSTAAAPITAPSTPPVSTLLSSVLSSSKTIATNLVLCRPLNGPYFLCLDSNGSSLGSYLFNSQTGTKTELPAGLSSNSDFLVWFPNHVGKQTDICNGGDKHVTGYVYQDCLFTFTVTKALTPATERVSSYYHGVNILMEKYALTDTKSTLTHPFRQLVSKSFPGHALALCAMVQTQEPSVLALRLNWNHGTNGTTSELHTIIWDLEKRRTPDSFTGSLARLEMSPDKYINTDFKVTPIQSFTREAQFNYLKDLSIIPIVDTASNKSVLVDLFTLEITQLEGTLSLNHNPLDDTYYFVHLDGKSAKLITNLPKLCDVLSDLPGLIEKPNFIFNIKREEKQIRLTACRSDNLEEYETVIQNDEQNFIYTKISDALNKTSPEATYTYAKTSENSKPKLVLTIDINVKYLKELITYTLEKKTIETAELTDRLISGLYKKLGYEANY